MKKFVLLSLLAILLMPAHAQIAYQVALLNKATGEPRANEQVKATIEITGADGTSIISETKNKTSNDFGILSFTIGDENTFDEVDWSAALPLFISVTVDGILIGKSQILNVPVAEHAKHYGSLTYELAETLPVYFGNRNVSSGYHFSADGTCSSISGEYCATGHYYIAGDMICAYFEGNNDYIEVFSLLYVKEKGCLMFTGGV